MPSNSFLPPRFWGKEHVAASLQWLCLTGANWFILAFMFVAFSSLTYPFNFEWMEGMSIDIIGRIMHGLPVYTKPSIEYVPYIYTPLYFYICALVAEITGLGFFPARLVSTLAALGIGVVIYLWIHKKNGDWEAGIIGAGLFFATYRLSGRWFDNSRVDSLFLFLTLLSLYIYTHYRNHRPALLAALIATAAFFTKQTALFMILPVLAAGFFIERRDTLIMAVAMALLLGSLILLANYMSDGWFDFFVFTLPAGHGIEKHMLWDFWSGDIFHPLLILFIISVVSVMYYTVENRQTGLFYAALLAGGIAASYIARLHGYGWINVLMPIHAVLALMTGLAFAHIKQRNTPWLMAALALAMLWQMHSLLYNPKTLIPDEKSIEAGNRFLEQLAKIKGDVFIPELQYVQTRAGKKSYALGMGAFDLFRSDLKERNDVKKAFQTELERAIADGRFSAIIPGRLVPTPGLDLYYTPRDHLTYPKEYVSGAINFLRTDLFVRIPNANHP